jgi:hypothetical protein
MEMPLNKMTKKLFQKNNYIVLKTILDPKIIKFCCDYLFLKRQAMITLYETGNLPPMVNYYGSYEDKQIPGTYSTYGDPAMETLLQLVKPIMEKSTGIKLNCKYAYARIYKKGDILHRHTDRPSCEISTTLNLGGDPWSIFLEPSGEKGKKGVEVKLKPGDMLVYQGCILEHWREPFKGKDCAQVFLHYANVKTSKNDFDNRPHLGLPSNLLFKRRDINSDS